MNSGVLVTGATGFLGSHLVLQFLKASDHDAIVCLARRSCELSARERVLQAIRNAEHDAGAAGTLARHAHRLVVVEDNLLSADPVDEWPSLAGLEGLPIESFWHCAASVKFVETESNEVWHTNVTGLRNALALASQLGVRTFNHVSTAYSCGTMSGRILESIEVSPAGFNNVYEESKHHGEQLVHRYCSAVGMSYRIIRPSIIIGHSRTYRTSSAAGFYYCLDALRHLHDRTVARDRTYFERHTLRVRVDRNATLDLIPVDFVVSEMVELDRRGDDTMNQVFHVTSESPISLCDWLKKVTPIVGIRHFEFADEDTVLSAVDRLFTKQVKAFLPYMTQRKVFDRSNAARYGVDHHQMDYLLDTERLTSFATTYLAEPGATALADRVA